MMVLSVALDVASSVGVEAIVTLVWPFMAGEKVYRGFALAIPPVIAITPAAIVKL